VSSWRTSSPRIIIITQPCKRFSPVLIDFYNSYAKPSKVEIIYVSSDKDVEEFEAYYEKMPWLAVPAEGTAGIKNALAQKLNISAIPTLIVLQAKTGKFITNNGRNEVTNANNVKEKAEELIETWKKTEAVPLEEASALQERPGIFYKIVQTFLQKPWYLIGLFYIVKGVIRKYNKYMEDHAGDEGEGGGGHAEF
jgi:nucleoredoxin